MVGKLSQRNLPSVAYCVKMGVATQCGPIGHLKLTGSSAVARVCLQKSMDGQMYTMLK